MPKGTAAALAALVLAASLAGCGNPVRAGQNPGTATTDKPVALAATGRAGGSNTGAGATSKVSHWKLQDLSQAEGRKLFAETHYGDTTVTADLTDAEKSALERLLLMPPGTSLKDTDLAADHLRRANQQSEFVYGLDGRFHRVIWRMVDATSGRTVGYRIHSQPKDLLSGKYIIAFYGADTRLLMAQPVWY